MSLPDSSVDPTWTRDELVTLAHALDEFRDEYGPGEHALAERLRIVLRGPGERFIILAVEDDA